MKNDAATKDRHHLKPYENNTITKETRQEAFITRPVTRAEEIIRFMGEQELTAREIAYGMGYKDLNAVKPRLTEMKTAGQVEVVRKAYDPITERNVAVWRVV